MLTEKRSITPQKAIDLFAKNGITINIEEAEQIIAFLYLLTEIFINEIAAV